MEAGKGSLEPIKTIERESVAEQVYQQMKHLIDTQVWKPGVRIPSENQLAKQFGVSRMTIRTAAQKLKAFGLLNIRSGSGSYVEAPTIDTYIGSASSDVSLNTLSEVYQLRYYLEQAAVELAIKNASEENIAELSDILKNLIDAAQTSPEDFRRYDLAFHRYIYVMANNQLLLTMFGMIENLFSSHMDKYDSELPPDELREGRIRLHQQLFSAIADRDVERALQQLHWYRDVSETSGTEAQDNPS